MTEKTVKQGFPAPTTNMYKVDVLSCTYNHTKYIEDCLNGVAMQKTDFPFVHHVIDDCSTDGEQDVIKAWIERECDINADFYDNDICTITIAKHKINLSYTIVAYFLKQNMYGNPQKRELIKSWQDVCTYLALCEGDDYWCDSHKLQKQIDYMEAHPDCMMTFHRAKCKWEDDDSERFTYDMEVCEDRDYSIDELFEHWIVPCASMVYRRGVADYPIMHRERFFSGDDVLYYSAAEMGIVHGFSDVMSVYRVHVDSVSRNKENEIRRLMVYPKHYINVYKNFPHINRSIVRRRIAEHLHHKMNVDHSFGNNLFDAICMLFWDWKYALTDIKQRLCWYFIPAIKHRLHIA